jgi:prevent-host-death family protein
MKSFAFSDLNRQSGEVLDAALAAPITLTKHGKPKLVVLSVEQFERMARHQRAYTIANAPQHIHDELMAGLDEILRDTDGAEPR